MPGTIVEKNYASCTGLSQGGRQGQPCHGVKPLMLSRHFLIGLPHLRLTSTIFTTTTWRSMFLSPHHSSFLFFIRRKTGLWEPAMPLAVCHTYSRGLVRTRFRIPFTTVSKFGHFCSLCYAPVHSGCK